MSATPQKEPVMDWLEIKAALHREGMTLAALSVRIGLTRSACGKVKTETNYKAQKAIAEIIGQKPEDLWPSRYPKGRPHILDTNKFPPLDSQNEQCGADKGAAA